MKKFRRYFLATIVVAFLVGLFALSSARTSNAKAPDDVRVVKAHQSGEWNVGITGTPTVKVGNTSAAPVLVRDVENPARQPFSQTLSFTIPDGQLQGQASLSVPAGKHFVIEYVSGLSEFNPNSFGGPVVFGALNTDFAGLVYFPWNAPSPNGACVAGQLMRAYVFQSALVFVERAGLQGSQDVKVSVTGYLVSTP